MPKVCLTHMISWPDRLGLPLWHTSGDDCLLTMILRGTTLSRFCMFIDIMKPNKAPINMLYCLSVMNLYDTNGSQVRQEFVQKIGKVFDAILEKVITSLSS
jgi:hypothetical protein